MRYKFLSLICFIKEKFIIKLHLQILRLEET